MLSRVEHEKSFVTLGTGSNLAGSNLAYDCTVLYCTEPFHYQTSIISI